MSSLSLEKSIKTCKTDPGQAERVASDRFLNPCNLICPMWSGYDSTGRPACPDSFYTKSAGCNSAQDRVLVENDLRPDYSEYITLSTQGFTSNLYGNSNTRAGANQANSLADLEQVRQTPGYGNFGSQMSATTLTNCRVNQYERAMAQMNCPLPPPCDPCATVGGGGGGEVVVVRPGTGGGTGGSTGGSGFGSSAAYYTAPVQYPGNVFAVSLPWNTTIVGASSYDANMNRSMQAVVLGANSHEMRNISGF
jgi:hypothetical protein